MNTRALALTKLVAGSAVFGSIWWYVFQHRGFGELKMGPIGVIAIGAPGAFVFAAMIELITGESISHLASKWDSLKGWERGVIGLVVVIAALALLIGGVALYGYLTS